MSGWLFPILLDGYTLPLERLRAVVEALLREPCIFAHPDPAESPRPDGKYSALDLLSDLGVGHPGIVPRALYTGSLPARPDVRHTTWQTRESLARVTCYRDQAFDRAALLSFHYLSPAARALCPDVALLCASQVKQSPRMLGAHWESAAFVDFRIRYMAQADEDVYSIQTTICPTTVR